MGVKDDTEEAGGRGVGHKSIGECCSRYLLYRYNTFFQLHTVKGGGTGGSRHNHYS